MTKYDFCIVLLYTEFVRIPMAIMFLLQTTDACYYNSEINKSTIVEIVDIVNLLVGAWNRISKCKHNWNSKKKTVLCSKYFSKNALKRFIVYSYKQKKDNKQCS